MASIRKTRGQPRHFTDEQNAALHAGLAELQLKKRFSQAKLGELLGVRQQAAGRLEKDASAGFSTATAKSLVRALGYASPETFFRARGIASADDASTGELEAKSA